MTLRDETEWQELVEVGVNRLAGADRARIVAAFRDTLSSRGTFDLEIYGGGRAAALIVDLLESFSPASRMPANS